MPATEEDVAKLKKALDAERAAHKTTKDVVKAAEAKIANLELAGGSPPTAQKLQEHLAAASKAAVAAATAELNGKLAATEAERDEAKKNGDALQGKLNANMISTAVREAARSNFVKEEALADVLTHGSLELKLDDAGNVVDAEGRDVADWLDAMKASRPYLWPTARGSGARGSGLGGAPAGDGGDNPWSTKGFNLTAQSQIYASDPARAARLKAAAQ